MSEDDLDRRIREDAAYKRKLSIFVGVMCTIGFIAAIVAMIATAR
jgi:hypothetical protein